MGEQPIFTSRAHVFTIDPQTKKSWIHVSNQSVDVNFFYDPIQKCYRIVSVDESSGTKKVVIHCSITEKMVFKKTSQKFGQWTDPKANQVYGLGFTDESELLKFIEHFNYAVNEAKAAAEGKVKTEPTVSNTASSIKKNSIINNMNNAPAPSYGSVAGAVGVPNTTSSREAMLEADLAHQKRQHEMTVQQLSTEVRVLQEQLRKASGGDMGSYDAKSNGSKFQNAERIKEIESQNASLRSDIQSLRSQLDQMKTQQDQKLQRIQIVKQSMKQQVQSLLATLGELESLLD